MFSEFPVSHIHVRELQKCSLPYCHMVIILRDEDNIRNRDDFDRLVSAEIPDENEDRELHDLVKKCMIRGPCGVDNPSSPCMENGSCQKKFPKSFRGETLLNVNGYPEYRRRDCGIRIQVGRHFIDNRYLVPYNAFLLEKYRAHINLEICSSVKSIKYIFKYVYKGHGCVSIEITGNAVNAPAINASAANVNFDGEINQHDEIKYYLVCKYATPPDAMWRLSQCKMHDKSHTVYRPAIHLPGQQRVYFRRGGTHQAADAQHNRDTTLTAWFKLSALDANAHHFLYCGITFGTNLVHYFLSDFLHAILFVYTWYIVIVHPMQSRSLCTVGTTKKILTILWILSLLMSCPTFYIMNTESHVFYNNDTEVVVTFCADSAVPASERLIYCIYQFLVMFALPTTVMSFCYSKVIYVLWISTKQLAQMTFTERRPSEFEDEGKQRQAFATGNCGSNYRTLRSDGRGSGKSVAGNNESNSGGCGGGGCRPKSSEQKKERRNILKRLPKEQSSEVLHARRQVIKMLIAIILTFLICWGPKLMFRMVRRMDPSGHGTNHSYLIKTVFDIFPYVQSCLNPIIYCFMSRNFRKSMRYVCNTYCQFCDYSSSSNETYELETKSGNGTSVTTRATKYGQSVISNDDSTTRAH